MATKKRPAKKSPRQRPAPKRPAAKPPARKRPASRPGETSRQKAKADLDERVAQIQRVIDLMVESGAVEVEMEAGGSRLRVRLKEDVPVPTILAQPGAPPAAAPYGAPLVARAAAPAPQAADEVEAEGEIFSSPMVGTLYQAPSPEAEPFVHVGDRVGPDTTLCIIEAMKVMNEIKAEMEGQIAAILVENGEPVEFGQPLFRIKP